MGVVIEPTSVLGEEGDQKKMRMRWKNASVLYI
jgi:hypothetical protein